MSDSQVRTYVLDTSVLLSDPWACTRFAEHEVVVPLVVISELGYDHATGQLVVRYEVAGATVRQADRRAIRMTRPLLPLDSLELSRT